MVNLWESTSISRRDFLFHLDMSGCGTIKTDLPTYKEGFSTHTSSLPHLFTFRLIIGFRSSSAQVTDSRVPKAQRFS